MTEALLPVLIEELRSAGSDAGDLRARVRASTARLVEDGAYRQLMQAEVRGILERTHATHALTELGLLSDETLVEGVLRRLGQRLAPAPPREDALEVELRRMLGSADRGWLAAVDVADASAWVGALMEEHGGWEDPAEVASTLVILATRVAGAGMDARLSERVPSLEAWTSPFLKLSRVVDLFAERLLRGEVEPALYQEAEAAIARCTEQLRAFREQKKELGTTLRLSSASLRMLQQLERLTLLLACTQVDKRATAVATLALQLSRASCQARPAIHFAHQKLELLAYLVVGHAAQRGAKYAVHTAGEYRGFWLKSLVGGFLVAIFACLKLHLSHEGLAPVPQALIFGANYALCFVLIFLLGATLATKQPALTASRLADSLRDGGAGGTSFPELVKAVWRSQFVSFLGNIGGAAAFAALFAYAFAALMGHDLIDLEEARSLAAKLHPFESGTVFYAAIAGVMLSMAGFIAGFIDNAVVFHRVAERVRVGSGVFWLVPGKTLRARLAARVEASTGAIAGNVTLGFMLGSAGAFGEITGIPFDIRHIAFASSHSTLALWHASELLSWRSVALLLASVSLIGLVNFLVSFSLTLSVAINARRLEGVDWRAQLRALWALVKERPASFFLPVGPSTAGDGI